MTIPKYNSLAIEYIEAFQKNKLTAMFGIDFEKNLQEIFPSTDFFLEYIESQLEQEFKDTNDDEKYELEAKLKNSATDEIINLTKYEFPQYKSLLNSAEQLFRQSVVPNYLDQIPYNATLHSFDPDAEIVTYEGLEKSIIFFHGGLFSANLMFCKLFIQLIADTKDNNTGDFYSEFTIKDDPQALAAAKLNAIYFYNYYLSDISQECPHYDLKTNFENSILAVFLNSLSFFIYAHECGHAFLKHHENADQKTDQDIWKEEFAADRFAMIHLGNYCNLSGANILTLLAPIIFFRYRILLEKFRPHIGEKATHPPTIHRLEKYISWLKQKIHRNDNEHLSSFLVFEEKTSSFLSSIFNDIKLVADKLQNNQSNAI